MPVEQIHDHLGACKEPGPEQVAGDRELLRLTDDLLAGLREGDHDLFERRFLEGSSLKTISGQTGLSLPALKTRFHRARLRLKQAAAGWGAMLPVAS